MKVNALRHDKGITPTTGAGWRTLILVIVLIKVC